VNAQTSAAVHTPSQLWNPQLATPPPPPFPPFVHQARETKAEAEETQERVMQDRQYQVRCVHTHPTPTHRFVRLLHITPSL